MQSDDAVNDAALDREIDRALGVDPSAGFVARVRTRIANQPARAPWGAWIFAASAVAAIAVAAIVVQRSSRIAAPADTAAVLAARPLPDSYATPPYVASAFPPPPGFGGPVAALAKAGRRTFVARGSTGSPRAVPAPARPELVDQPPRFALRRSAVASAKAEGRALIDPREAAALRNLIAGVRSGSVDLRPVLRASSPTAMDLPPIDDIVISPITIEPLAPATGAEGVRQ